MWDKTVWGLHLQSGQYLLRELVSTKRRLLGFKGKPTTTQHRNHQIATTHTTTKKKNKDQREKADRWQDRPRGGDRSASGGWRDQPKGGDDLTQRRTRPVKRRQASCGAISAGWSRRDLASVFGCILKIILENNFQCFVTFWKCYFLTNFSHFLNHFLNFQTNFIS